VAAVWEEITRTDGPQGCFYNSLMDTPGLRPGAPVRMRSLDKKFTFVVGEVLEFDPPRKFSHTFRFADSEDPPCKVTYLLEPTEGGVRFTLISEDVPAGTKTEKNMAGGNKFILKTLKEIVETGRPALGTRILYAMMPWMSFMLPKRLRSENHP
jgi:uncharacterized protein YndB with AHSA1/START domain